MPKNAFICYSHKDKRYLELLKRHLKYPEEKYQLKIWDDQSIQPGQKWQHALNVALAEAQVAVLLVSAYFLSSEFITKEELPVLLKAAQEEKITLIPVLISHCLIDETPLAKFKAANSTPLTWMSKGKREEALSQIAKQILEALLQTTEAENHAGK